MKRQMIWNMYARFYERLFTQKASLAPTRKTICKLLRSHITDYEVFYNIFDCGCGTGQLIFEIVEEFKGFKFKIMGIDCSERMIEIAKKKNNHPYIEFCLKEFVLVEESNKYDIILCTHALPYFDDINKTMEMFSGMLNSDGVIYLAQASTNNLYDKMVLFLLKLVTWDARYPSIEEVKNIIYNNGLAINRVELKRENKLMPTIFVMEIIEGTG